MGKLDQSGVVVKPPTQPPGHAASGGKVRRFPWRLWLWALLMTAAAGAGGYFTWHFKNVADSAVANESDALTKFGAKEKECADKAKALTDKTTEATACIARRDELDKTNKTLGTQLSANKDELTELAKIVEQNKAQLDAAKDFQQQFSKMIDSGAIKVITRHGNLVLSLPAEVLFPSGVSDLSDDGRIKVHEIGFTLKDKGPKDGKGNPKARYLVVGHSDNTPLKGSIYKDNWELSAARALTVTRELVKAGMRSENLLPAGAGDHDPIAPNTSAKDLARNRRIEIVLLPAIADLSDPRHADTNKKPDKK